MPQFLPASARQNTRVMMFVDGENLAKRYQSMAEDRRPGDHVVHQRDVLVWSEVASRPNGPQEYIRRHYYTSCGGDDQARRAVAAQLRKVGIEAPRVFARPRSGRSKRVDITLTTEMLTHAHRRNYDVAVLVAGDEDYVPLVEAVKAEGVRVALWFVESGLSPALQEAADHYWDMAELFFNDRSTMPAFYAIYQ